MNATVACVFVNGHVRFTSEYVTRLRAMAARSLPAHRFVCLTDQPKTLPKDMDRIVIPTPKNMFGWWSKLQLFNPAHALEGRVFYFDLDVLLVGDLMQIAQYPARFALAADGAPNFRGKGQLKVVKRFNSSVMVWNAGEQDYLYTDWNRSVTERLHGDQDWIGERARDAVAMPLEWFPRISETRPPWPEAAKVVLVKKPKNHEAAKKWPWFAKEWQ